MGVCSAGRLLGRRHESNKVGAVRGPRGVRSLTSYSKTKKTPRSERRGRRRPPANEVGDALRSVYDRAVAEDIPPEMLDLLGKLG